MSGTESRFSTKLKIIHQTCGGPPCDRHHHFVIGVFVCFVCVVSFTGWVPAGVWLT